MQSINCGDIIRFKIANSDAALFCLSRGITGKIVSVYNGSFEIDVGFAYYVYARDIEIEIVASVSEQPLPEDVI